MLVLLSSTGVARINKVKASRSSFKVVTSQISVSFSLAQDGVRRQLLVFVFLTEKRSPFVVANLITATRKMKIGSC